MSDEIDDRHYNLMRRAREEAEKAAARDEVPIGAVIADPQRGTVIAADGNRTREYNDPSAHAEMLVIRAACAEMGAQRIPGLDLYVTLEPCTMCAAAISFARLRHIYYAAPDPKGGGIDHGAHFFDQPTCHHRPHVTGGLMAAECGTLLKNFFAGKR